MNEHLQDSIAEAAQTAHQALREDKISAASVAKVTKRLAEQDARLDTVEKRVKDLAWENRRGGGFPWGLLILAGGAYAAYRFVPAVQKQVDRLIGQVDPGAEGNLNRAEEAGENALHAGVHGDDPRIAAKAAVGELKGAGDKAGNTAKDKVEDLADRLKD